MTRKPKKPVVIDAETLDTEAPSPAEAPPVPDAPPAGTPAMVRALGLSARGGSRTGRILLGAVAGVVGLWASVGLWDWVAGLFTRSVILGSVAAALGGILALAVVVFLVREVMALARLGRISGLQARAATLRAGGDLGAARALSADVSALYRGRATLSLARDKVQTRRADLFDADAVLTLTETELLAPLDAVARQSVARTARGVAASTALVPLAFADVAVALVANIAMIRRIAEIYGGRAGTLGALRLVRAVAAHLLATGAVAVGDDLIGSVAGGGLISKLSRRFGEGVVNGALTARVGVAAIEVCRPMPFAAAPRPRTTSLVQEALSGLFSGSDRDA
ncbi:MAG: TIGR01620 family protein [Pseudomonadota bacterium]